MKFVAGDIGTHNKYECSVEAVEGDRVQIAYAVFVGDERIFDKDDMKWVNAKTVKLVKRDWGATDPGSPLAGRASISDTDSLPSFSVRQDRWLRKQQQNEEAEGDVSIDLTADSQIPLTKKGRRSSSVARRRPKVSRPSRSSDISPASKAVNPVRHSKPTRPKRVSRSPRLRRLSDSDSSSSSSSGSSSSSSSSSSSGSSRATVVVRPRKRISRVSIDYTPVPIVPDSFVDDDEEDEDSGMSELSGGSEDDYSEDGDEMVRLANSFKQRVKGGEKPDVRDEVVFAWDSQEGKVQPVDIGRAPPVRRSSGESMFIEQDTPSVASPRNVVNSIAQLPDRFPVESWMSTATPVELIRSVWDFVDSMHLQVDDLESSVTHVRSMIESMLTTNPNCTPNMASELRILMTAPSFTFKSMTGWAVGLTTVRTITHKFKPQLVTDSMAKIWAKIAIKLELRLAYIFAALVDGANDAMVTTVSVREALAHYSSASPEGKALIGQVVSQLAKRPACNSLMYAELIPVVSSVIATLCVQPLEITPSLTARFRGPVVSHAIEFVAQNLPTINYLPTLVKSGGFLTLIDPGETRFEFGKHRGALFRHVIQDRGFCDWSQRITDPSSVGFVEWIDYISRDRFFAVMGTRTVRADIELMRLAKENMTSARLEAWIEHRGMLTLTAVTFYHHLVSVRKWVQATHFLSYAVCTYLILFELASGLLLPLPEYITDSLSSLPRPRAEIVMEIFRPMLKIGQLFPTLKDRVAAAIVKARATSHSCTLGEARSDLLKLHSIDLT